MKREVMMRDAVVRDMVKRNCWLEIRDWPQPQRCEFRFTNHDSRFTF